MYLKPEDLQGNDGRRTANVLAAEVITYPNGSRWDCKENRSELQKRYWRSLSHGELLAGTLRAATFFAEL